MQTSEKQSARPDQRPAGFRVRISNEDVGKTLDHKAASAYALQMLAYSLRHGNGFTLNEHRVAKPYSKGGLQLGERKFRAGLKVLKTQSILHRRTGGRKKGGRGAFARDTLACVNRAFSYVEIEETLIYGPPKLMAFVAATRLERFPRKATDIAKRIGIKSVNTIKGLIKQAVNGGYLNAVPSADGWMVARLNTNLDRFKKVAVKNVGIENVATEKAAVKNVAAHRIPEDEHSNLSDSHHPLDNEHSKLAEAHVTKGARAQARGPAGQQAKADRKVRKEATSEHAARVSSPTDDDWISDLRKADVGRLLAGYLLRPRGIQPYLRLVEQYGMDARNLLVANLRTHGASGKCDPGCWKNWKFLKDALDSGMRLEAC